MSQTRKEGDEITVLVQQHNGEYAIIKSTHQCRGCWKAAGLSNGNLSKEQGPTVNLGLSVSRLWKQPVPKQPQALVDQWASQTQAQLPKKGKLHSFPYLPHSALYLYPSSPLHGRPSVPRCPARCSLAVQSINFNLLCSASPEFSHHQHHHPRPPIPASVTSQRNTADMF